MRLHAGPAGEAAAQVSGLHAMARATGGSRFVDLSAYGPEIYQIAAA